MAFHRNFSSLVSATNPVKSSKDAASLVACTLKKLFGWGCGFFVSDVISGRLFGQLNLAMGSNH